MASDQIFSRRLIAWIAHNLGPLKAHYQKSIGAGAPTWRILLYQRIVDPEAVPYPVSFVSYVKPNTFERHCFYLWKNCNVVSLSALLELIEQGKEIPPGTVALTFDGGYEDFYRNAFPILQRFKLPATVFLPTSFIGTNNWFWTDKVMLSLLMLSTLKYPFPKFSFLDKDFLQVLQNMQPGEEMTLEKISALIEELKRRTPQERTLAMSVIGQHVETHGGLPVERMFLNWEEIQTLHASKLIEFGTLGHTHTDLTEIDPPAVTADLQQSIAELRQRQIEPIPAMSFPYGKFNRELRKHLFSIGVKHGLAPGRTALPNLRQELCAVFGRTPMYQHVSFCNELFTCRLWDYKFLKMEF